MVTETTAQPDANSPAAKRRAEVAAELANKTMYELLGSEDGIKAIVDSFYDVMDRDEEFALIRDMHKADLSPMRVSLFEFLSGWLGGPPLFIERNGSPCLTGAHAPYNVDEQAGELWVSCMNRALAEAEVEEKYRDLLAPAFERMADMVRNDG
ncbi:MAG: group II truncated hemoglobin [Ilumatobacteraceae bacterium]|nr:group II truncated hemoglobin [Ilumatobacteraceae bacterium]